MNRYVCDTHSLYRYLTASPRLGTAAKGALDDGVAGMAIIILPAIVLAELFYLNEKAGRPLDFARELNRLRLAAQFRFLAFSPDDVADFEVDKTVPEMHDRMIVGAARRLGATCITKDTEIVASGIVQVVW